MEKNWGDGAIMHSSMYKLHLLLVIFSDLPATSATTVVDVLHDPVTLIATFAKSISFHLTRTISDCCLCP